MEKLFFLFNSKVWIRFKVKLYYDLLTYKKVACVFSRNCIITFKKINYTPADCSIARILSCCACWLQFSYTKVKIERYFLKTKRIISKTTWSILGLYWFECIFHEESKYGNDNLNFEILLKKSIKKMSSAPDTCVERFIKGYTEASI